MRRRIVLTATAVAMLMISVIGIAGPAQAASCSGASCIGKDPQGQGCSPGAANLASIRPPGGGPAILLRWSSTCVANWARFDENSGSYSPGYWNYWVETSDGHRENKLFNNASWTWMVNGNLYARACIQGLATTQYSCTGWY